jgi:undecaprenyl diphosphate synthase
LRAETVSDSELLAELVFLRFGAGAGTLATRSMPKAASVNPPAPKAPRHLAVIMDGNGRWAKERGLPRTEGHRRGADAVRRTVEACVEMGVEFLTLYAFSSENWQRPKSEVEALMKLLDLFLRTKLEEMLRNNVRFQAIGRLTNLPGRCQEALHGAIARTAENTGLTLILALSYGGREEIVDGVKSIVRHVQEGHLDPAMITPEVFGKHLYTRYWPDPDLLIRTSGEMRLSNFLLWQISYSELWVTKKLWPDFGKEDLVEAFDDFWRRHRRFGGLA